jgi:hypothetical protein
MILPRRAAADAGERVSEPYASAAEGVKVRSPDNPVAKDSGFESRVIGCNDNGGC